LRPLIAVLLVLALPGALYFIWRWQYYGFFLPNTFYVKLSDSLSRGTVSSMLVFGRQYLLLTTIGVVAAYISSFDETATLLRQKHRQYLAPANLLTLGSLIVFTLILMGYYLRSNLGMNFSYRFYAPLYPVALLSLASILSPSLDAIRSHSRTRPCTFRCVYVGLCLILLIQTGFHMKWFYLKEMPYASGYKTLLQEEHRTAGLYLKQRVPASEWLVVHIDSGAIPFYSGLKTVDFGGLNDEYLAHHKAGSLEDRVNYFFSKEPGVLVFTTYDWNRMNHGKEVDAIIADPRFGNYALVKKFGSSSTWKDYYEFVFLRRDLLQPDEEIEIDQHL